MTTLQKVSARWRQQFVARLSDIIFGHGPLTRPDSDRLAHLIMKDMGL